MNIFKVLTIFDYITPVLKTTEDVTHGNGWPILLPETKLEEAQGVLRRNGITAWTAERYALNRIATITVAHKDYADAIQALAHVGIQAR